MKKNVFTLVLGILMTLNAYSTNIVSNGNFELPGAATASWWVSTGITGNSTFDISTTTPISGTNSALITVNTTGSSASNSGIYQFISVPKASVYTVSYTAKSSAPCSMTAVVLEYFGAGTWLASGGVSLTSTAKTFTFTLGTNLLPTTVGICKLAFFCGTAASGTQVWIDDVTVTEKTPLTDLNLVNGDFENDQPNILFASSSVSTTPVYGGWNNVKTNTATNSSMTAVVDNTAPISGTQSLKITATGTASTKSNDLMLIYVFAGLKDAYYTVSFKAKASSPCTMGTFLTAWDYTASPSCDYISEKTSNLTTEVQTFSYSSTLPFLNVGNRANIRFLFGKLPNGVSVWLDDVQVSMAVNSTAVSKVIADNAAVKVYTVNGQVRVSTPIPAKASVYSINGKLVSRHLLTEGDNQFALDKGNYVVIVETATQIIKSIKLII